MMASVCAITFCASYAAVASLYPIAPAAIATPAATFPTLARVLLNPLSRVRKPNDALFPAPSNALKSLIARAIPLLSKVLTMFTPTAIGLSVQSFLHFTINLAN